MSALARAARLWGEACSVDGPTGNVRVPKETGPAAISVSRPWFCAGDPQPGFLQVGPTTWYGFPRSNPAEDARRFLEQAAQEDGELYGFVKIKPEFEREVDAFLDPDGPVAS